MTAAARPALRTGRVAEIGLLIAVGALLAGAVLDGAGSRDDSLATVGIAAIVCAALGLGVAFRGALPLPRLERAGVVLVVGSGALTAWAGLSIAWSVAGDLSWEWLARGLVYLSFLALGLLAGATAEGARRVAALTAIVIAAALAWALLGVAIPSLFPDGDRISRLREPVGYWNALALLAGAAIAFGLWIARTPRVTVRVGGCLLVYVAAVALLLTQSRAGVAGAVAVLALWLVLSDERLSDGLRAALALLPALAVGGWAFTRPALVEDGALRVDRVDDGRVFAVLLIVGALVVGVAAWRVRARRLASERGPAVRAVLVGMCALAVAVGAVGLVATVGNPFSWASSQISGGECVNDPGRLTDLCANNRLAWWEEAIRVAADHPARGSGAGTFALARRRHREDATAVSQPHSVPLQLLADLGAIGFALGLLVACGAAVGIVRGLRRTAASERPAAVALASLVLAYAVHALVDYDLDFLAVTAPALVATGTLLAVARPASAFRLGLPGLVALGAVAVAAAAAVALPALADRDAERALGAVDAGRISDAVEAADRARALNPLSPAPLQARALAADAEGDRRAAVAWYERATDLQPENPDLWFDLGLYHVVATEDQCAAYQALNRSYTLDPRSSRWAPGGPLDIARVAVNAGACER
ncbi:MAG TPA: O-antigen ligase family protein [Gaiella sp.]|uniref:O-antigen ligase family protein n=1 Tax=Gaiella sp. TaxID=2663207 RepID=UPI002D807B3E|nr:O-antigen ligase family protein [Gaiella sp.]HET9288940.1 O-antigen ligase family protein [Gaiella sp.]